MGEEGIKNLIKPINCLLFLVVMLGSVSCQPNYDKGDSLVLEKLLNVPFKDPREPKGLKVELLTDRMSLEGNGHRNIESLLQGINSVISNTYSDGKLDSVLSIQFYIHPKFDFELYNELRDGVNQLYNDHWDSLSVELFGMSFRDLSHKESKQVTSIIPILISEIMIEK